MIMAVDEIMAKNYCSYLAEDKDLLDYGTKSDGSISDDSSMSPVIKYIFDRLFGDVEKTERLKSLLGSLLKLPPEDLEDLTIITPGAFKATMKDGRQIYIEIQLLPFADVPERTLYYWIKIYSQHLKEDYGYEELKKFITAKIIKCD